MRTIVICLMFIGIAAPLHAQSQPASSESFDVCQNLSTPPHVVVQMRDGRTLRGTLLCLGDRIDLAEDGRLSRYPLRDVTKIAEPRDPVWDGAAKGAAVGLLFWALCGGGCDASQMLRVSAYYGVYGLTMDALKSNNKTFYRAGAPSPSLSWRIRF